MSTPSKKVIPAVFDAVKPAGVAWPSDLQAPAGDGTNVSIPPMFGGHGPGVEITAVNTPKLGVGTAEPAFHGGG